MSADGEQGGVTRYEVIENLEGDTWDVVARPQNICVASFDFEDEAWDYAIHLDPAA